jgi:hypothetical protein
MFLLNLIWKFCTSCAQSNLHIILSYRVKLEPSIIPVPKRNHSCTAVSASQQVASSFKFHWWWCTLREHIILPLQILVAGCCDSNHFSMTNYWPVSFLVSSSLIICGGNEIQWVTTREEKSGPTAGHHSHLWSLSQTTARLFRR